MSRIADRDQLITQATRLRDYMMRAGLTDEAGLVGALLPFEHDDETPDENAVKALYAAFETTHLAVIKRVDAYTVNEVLNGNSPFKRRTLAWAAGGLTLLGIIFVGLALHYSAWSTRTNSVLSQSERFVAFDHFGEIMGLVELQNYFSEMGDLVEAGASRAALEEMKRDLEPNLLYMRGISVLREQYIAERNLPERMTQLEMSFNPFVVMRQWPAALLCPFVDIDPLDLTPEMNRADLVPKSSLAVQLKCSNANDMRRALLVENLQRASRQAALNSAAGDDGAAGGAEAGAMDELVDGNKSAPRPSTEPRPSSFGDVSEMIGAEGGDFAFNAFLRINEELRVRREETMREAGRIWVQDDYRETVAKVKDYALRLQNKLNIVHRWALPVIYGCLGSIVYCMWRVLTPAVAPLGFFYTTLRVAFAGLAALTLSMLLVPSNTLAMGADVNRPFIYLLSFIFGYSIEAFVNTLNGLNRSLAASLAPRDDRESAGARS